jgi:hypothetical protein
VDRIIDGDRFPLSPRIRALKAIRAKIRPEPERERLPAAEALRAATRRKIAEEPSHCD